VRKLSIRTRRAPGLVLLACLACLGATPAAAARGGSVEEEGAFQDGLRAHRSGDYLAAFRKWLPLARQGYAEAQHRLGVMFLGGEGTPQDDAEAEKWFRRAGEQGLVDAQYSLGLLYERGRAVPLDPELAHMWFNLAAANSNAGKLREEAVQHREAIGRRLTPTQLARTQRLAREWQPGRSTPEIPASSAVPARPGLAPGPAPARPSGKIYLRYGSPVEVESWWEQGEVLFYVHGGVIHGVPRSDLARIEDMRGRTIRVRPDTAGAAQAQAGATLAPEPGVSRRALLHLRYGYAIEVDDAWGDGDFLSYEKGGVVSMVLRADVIKIERLPARSAPPAPPAPPARRVEVSPPPPTPEPVPPREATAARRESERTARAAPAPAPEQSAGEALRALKGLQSVTAAKVDYQTYAPRVLDAKGHVERFLQRSRDGEPEVRKLLAEAIAFHDLASSAWSAKIVDRLESYEAAGDDALLERCPRVAIGSLLRLSPLGRGLALSFGGIPGLWACASDRIVEAERLLRRAGS